MYNDPNAQQPAYGPSPYISPYEQQYNPQPTPPPYPPTQYGVPPAYPQPVYVPQPQPPKSNKTVWIVLGVLGGIFLLLASVCGLSVYYGIQTAHTFSNNLHATEIAGETSPQEQAQSYYLSISVQDYIGAYAELAPNITQKDGTPLTLMAFTQQAQALDTSEGQVSTYITAADASDATKVAVQVTRTGGQTYTVNLTFT
ncbi:MAG: hypothetical protein ACRDHZ_12485, partial [Ktedonobacteraceae bacterium]